jgi:hypothetical protein
MKANDTVKFAEIKEAGDELARFEVIEIRGERVLVADKNSTAQIAPTFVYLAEELTVC